MPTRRPEFARLFPFCYTPRWFALRVRRIFRVVGRKNCAPIRRQGICALAQRCLL